MSISKHPAMAAGLLLAMAAPLTAFAAISHYEFHAVDPVVELASGDSILVDLLLASAVDANLYGRFDFDGDSPNGNSILGFSGSAWGISFSLPQAWLSLYPASMFGGDRDAIFVGPGNPAAGQIMLGNYTLFLAGLQYLQPAPWIQQNIGDGSPESLALLVGTPALMEMCFSGPDSVFGGCLFLHGVETTEVPVPAAGGLLVAALAGLAALRRHSRRA